MSLDDQWCEAVTIAQEIRGMQNWHLHVTVADKLDNAEAIAGYLPFKCADVVLNREEMTDHTDLVALAVHELIELELEHHQHYGQKIDVREFLCDAASEIVRYYRNRDALK